MIWASVFCPTFNEIPHGAWLRRDRNRDGSRGRSGWESRLSRDRLASGRVCRTTVADGRRGRDEVLSATGANDKAFAAHTRLVNEGSARFRHFPVVASHRLASDQNHESGDRSEVAAGKAPGF